MPKIILEFDKDTELDAAQSAIKASSLCCAIDAIFNEVFRKRWKYDLSKEDEALSKVELVEKMRDEAYEIMSRYDVADLVP
jgi:hypothetical protein